MKLYLEEKHVLISGGSRGIGYACARAFLEEGSIVTILARNSVTLNDAVQSLSDKFPGQIHGLIVDVSDSVSVARCFSLLPLLPDILVNCAGSANRSPTHQLSTIHWQQAMKDKLTTYLNTMELFLKLSVARGNGTIVNVIGIGGKIPAKNHVPGCAMNAALMSATVAFASESAKLGIRVNGVNPALTYTDKAKQFFQFEADSTGKPITEIYDTELEKFPMGEFVTLDTVANTVLFLSSESSRSINGTIITIDGARSPMI